MARVVSARNGRLHCSLFLSPRLSRAAEQGLLDYLRRKWFPQKCGCYGVQTTVRPVSLELVQTAFVMAAAGLALAAMLLALERLVKICRNGYSARIK